MKPIIKTYLCPMPDSGLYERARDRVKSRKKFYSHIFSWVIMSVFFIMINLFTTDYFWAIFPILAWGIGVAFHGIQVFSDEWEDEQVDREYDRLRKQRMDNHGRDDLGDFENLEDFKDLRKEWKDQDFV